MTPAKPGGVPPEAVWSAEDGEWVLAERGERGRMQGVVTYRLLLSVLWASVRG